MKRRIRLVWQPAFLLFVINPAFVPHLVFAQPAVNQGLYADLRAKEANAGYRQDSSYIDLLNVLAHNYYGISADSAFMYSKKALSCSEKAGYARGEAESWRMIGNTYEMIGDYPNMLSSYHHSLSIAERIGNLNLIAKAHLNIALFYKELGAYDAALAQMDEVIRIYARSTDSVQLAYVLNHQSDIFFRQQDYDKALHYAQQALQVVTALSAYQQIASFNNEMGRILAAKGEYKASLEHHLQSLDYYNQRDDKLGKTETTVLLAQTYLMLKDYPRALRFAQDGLSLAREIKRRKEAKEAGKVLADIYEAKGDYRSSLEYYKIYKEFSDSLFNDATRRQAFAMETRFEYERKEALLKEEAARKEILQQHIARNHALQTFIAILLILFLSVLAFILFRSRAEKQRTNQLLETKNREIGRQKEEMEHQAVQLLLNNQQKDKLFSIIAHDLKGPLNSLKGLLDFLKEKSLSDAEIRSMMAELGRNVDYSAELVNNLLFWASSQLNGMVVTPVVLHLRQLTAETMILFAKQAADKQVTLNNELGASLEAYADKDMIQVIIRNLFSNAIKFCRPGDSITVSGKIAGNAVEVCMSDTGIGIREDVLEKINRKESITTYGTAKEKGTGLGILLCREFAGENKGRFWIESQWGKGSRFYFAVPLPDSSSSMSV